MNKMFACVLLLLVFPVPGNADEVRIIENESGITVEYTGTPETAPIGTKKSEVSHEPIDTAPAEVVPNAPSEIEKMRQDRRMQRQLRQRSAGGQDGE